MQFYMSMQFASIYLLEQRVQNISFAGCSIEGNVLLSCDHDQGPKETKLICVAEI